MHHRIGQIEHLSLTRRCPDNLHDKQLIIISSCVSHSWHSDNVVCLFTRCTSSTGMGNEGILRDCGS